MWKKTLTVLCIGAVLSIKAYIATLVSFTEVVLEDGKGHIEKIQLPQKDAKILENFLRELMIFECIPYTLAGAKPVSFYACKNSSEWIDIGWQIWQKYSSLFQSENFVFWKESSPWVEGISFFVVANKAESEKLFQAHKKDFEEILNIDRSEKLFQDLKTSPFFTKKLKMNEMLLGMLLGFGKENGSLYAANRPDIILPIVSNALVGEESSKWRYIFPKFATIADLHLPKFVGNPHSEESLQLVSQYIETRKKIQAFYKTRSFLSATLSLFKHGSSLLESHNTCSDKKSSCS